VDATADLIWTWAEVRGSRGSRAFGVVFANTRDAVPSAGTPVGDATLNIGVTWAEIGCGGIASALVVVHTDPLDAIPYAIDFGMRKFSYGKREKEGKKKLFINSEKERVIKKKVGWKGPTLSK